MATDVFIIAGMRLYRQGLTQALAADPRFRVVGAAADHAQGLSGMARLSPGPVVAVLDIGVGSGGSSARRLQAALPEVRVVALVTDETEESVVAWAEAGVAGLVTPDTSLGELMATVECVAQGGAHCSPQATAALMHRVAAMAQARRAEPRHGQLTQREHEIVALIDRGLSNKQIARELQIELATVKNHVHSVLEKLHVERRGAAAAAVRRHAELAANGGPPADEADDHCRREADPADRNGNVVAPESDNEQSADETPRSRTVARPRTRSRPILH